MTDAKEPTYRPGYVSNLLRITPQSLRNWKSRFLPAKRGTRYTAAEIDQLRYVKQERGKGALYDEIDITQAPEYDPPANTETALQTPEMTAEIRAMLSGYLKHIEYLETEIERLRRPFWRR